MQFHIKDEAVGRGGTPALNHSQIRNGIKRRIYFDHFEVLRVPTKSLIRAQCLGIPMPNKTRIGPTGRPNENFSIFRLNRVSRSHSEPGITSSLETKRQSN